MISKEELRAWLEGDSYHPLMIEDEHGRQRIYCKIPKNERFDYLYTPEYGGQEISRYRSLENAGIYDRVTKKLYDSRECFSKIDPDIQHPKNANDMQDELTATVCAIIERRVDNKPENLETTELSSRGKGDIENYTDYGAKNDARAAFLEGKTSADIKYQCWYSCNDWNHEEDFLSYIEDPTGYAKREAEHYFETHQQDILLTLKKNELIRAELSALEQMEDGPVHRVRDIIAAVKGTAAKSVNVTVHKGGKELTFKMEAHSLKFDPKTFYSSWDMPSKDRRAFDETFGEYEHFYPKDIVDISYCGKSIYSAEPYEEPVEAEEIAQTM